MRLYVQVHCDRGLLQIRAATGPTISSNDFRPGVTLELDGAPWRVMGRQTILELYRIVLIELCVLINKYMVVLLPGGHVPELAALRIGPG